MMCGERKCFFDITRFTNEKVMKIIKGVLEVTLRKKINKRKEIQSSIQKP